MDMPAAQLSGGELSRLILAKLMLRTVHVLIMDEPTNDLDVETLESLSDCLTDFRGAVILVSHDRYFMDQNCDVIWAFDPITNTILTFADTHQWEDWHRENKREIKKSLDAKNMVKSSNNRAGLSYKEKLEFEEIESVIAREESSLQKLQQELDSPHTQSDYTRLAELGLQITSAEKKIEKLFVRWEELTAKNKT